MWKVIKANNPKFELCDSAEPKVIESVKEVIKPVIDTGFNQLDELKQEKVKEPDLPKITKEVVKQKVKQNDSTRTKSRRKPKTGR